MHATRVIICDEDLPALAETKRLLESRAYVVVAATSSGKEAVQAAQANRPDVALVDVKLSGAMSGLETARALNQSFSIPVIFMARKSDEITISRISASSPFSYLVKPFDVVALAVNIEIALYNHRVEVQLRKQEAYYRGLFTNAHDAILVVSAANGEILDVNQRAVEAYGFGRSELIGRALPSLQENPGDIAPFLKQAGAGSEGATVFKTVHRKKDGQRIFFEVSATHIDFHGKPAILSINRDIGERLHSEEALKQVHDRLEELVAKRTDELNRANLLLRQEIADRLRVENALRESEQNYRTLVEASPIAILRMRQNQITFINEAGLRLIERTDPAEVIGKTIYDFVHPDFQVEARRILEGVPGKAGSTGYLELAWVRPDGARFDIALTYLLIAPTDPLTVQFTVQDISTRKQLEKTLERQAGLSELELTINQGGDLRVGLQRVAQIIARFLPPGVCSALVMWEKAQNAFWTGFHLAVHDNASDVERVLLRADGPARELVTRRETVVIDNLGQVPSAWGEELRRAGVHSLAATPVQIEEEVFGVLFVLTPIPMQYIQSCEEYLVQAASRIALGVARTRLYQSLEKARSAAEEAGQAKAMFLANISHELRTPLSAMISLSELLQDTRLDLMQKGFVQTIQISAERLMVLIDDILDFSRIEARKLQLQTRPYELRSCIETAIDMVASTADEKDLALVYSIDERIPASIFGDPIRVGQVLTNLLGNGVKYTQEGHVRLTVTLTRPESAPVPAVDWQHGSMLLFAVQDTGIGIPPDRLETIFDAFTQLNFSASGTSGGVGLGLSIARQLVTMMGGEIWAESKGLPGAGSTFFFTLPLVAATGPLHPHLIQNQSFMTGKRIWVASKQEAVRQALNEQCAFWGADPQAFDSMDALSAAAERQESPDALLIDPILVQSGGSRGVQALLRLCSSTSIVTLNPARTPPLPAWPFPADAHIRLPYRVTQLFGVMTGLFQVGSPAPAGDGAPQKMRLPAGRSEGEGASFAAANWRPTVLKATATTPAAFGAQAGSLDVVIAEDNATLARALAMQLERLGLQAVVTGSGAELVSAVRARRFDLVLTDLLMPEMDGAEATQFIRQNLPPEAQPYIIGLSADARPGIREEMLQLGMNDYLTKPVSSHTLQQALERMAATRPAPPSVPPGTETFPDFIDPAPLLDFQAAMGANANRALAQLYDSFLATSPALVEKIRVALQRKNWRDLRSHLHTLRGNAGLFGAIHLTNRCKLLETVLQEGKLDAVNDQVGAVQESYKQLCAFLTERRAAL